MLSLYLPTRTWAHRVQAGPKLAGLCLISIAMLPVDDLAVMCLFMMAVLALYAALGKDACRQLAVLRPLVPILVVLFGLHLWVTGWEDGFISIGRLLSMAMLANAVTTTTTMSDMMDAVMPLLSPLRIFGVATDRIALAVALVIRFVPVLLADWASMERSWRARGGGRRTWRMLPAFSLGVLRLSNNVGNALDARGFAARRRIE